MPSVSLTGSLSTTMIDGSAVFLGNVHCRGDEAMLTDCSASPDIQCLSSELAGVRCEGKLCYNSVTAAYVYTCFSVVIH